MSIQTDTVGRNVLVIAFIINLIMMTTDLTYGPDPSPNRRKTITIIKTISVPALLSSQTRELKLRKFWIILLFI